MVWLRLRLGLRLRFRLRLWLRLRLRGSSPKFAAAQQISRNL